MWSRLVIMYSTIQWFTITLNVLLDGLLLTDIPLKERLSRVNSCFQSIAPTQLAFCCKAPDWINLKLPHESNYSQGSTEDPLLDTQVKSLVFVLGPVYISYNNVEWFRYISPLLGVTRPLSVSTSYFTQLASFRISSIFSTS